MATTMTRIKPAATPAAIEGGTTAQQVVAALGSDSAYLAKADRILQSDVTNWIPSGIPLLDYQMGTPGYPIGRWITFMGKEGSWKTGAAMRALKSVQDMGGLGVFIDAENSFSRERAERMGIDCGELIMGYPESLEEAFGGVWDEGKEKKKGITDRVIKATHDVNSSVPVLIVIDSLTSLKLLKNMEGDSSKQPGTVASYMSDYLPKLMPRLAKNHATVILINQLRHHIDLNTIPGRGSERRKVMGDKWSMIAEQALIYYSSVMIHFAAIGTVPPDKSMEPMGITVRATIPKSKVGPGEGKQAIFDAMKDKGIDTESSMLDVLTLTGDVEENGGWFKYKDKSFHRADWHGQLILHPELYDLVAAAPTAWQQKPASPLLADDEDDD